MDFVIHLPRTLRKHEAVWVMVDRITKSIHFLTVQITFTLEELCRLYIQEIIRLHGVPISIYGSFLGEFPKIHGDMVDDDNCFSSTDGWSVREDYPDFRGHATGMSPRY